MSFVSRRDFLRSVAAGGAALAVAGQSSIAWSADDWGGFKIGLQSYTLREFDTAAALEQTVKFGLHYWESFAKHFPISTLPKTVEAYKKQLADSGVQMIAFGVVGFDTNETKAREIFDYAKSMGMLSISADPNQDKGTFDLLDKLVAEYDIAIGIHNHGPFARYNKADDVLKWVKDRHPKIGACVDTGHYLRSNENIVEVIEKFGPRVFGVHFKDVRTIRDAAEKEKLLKELTPGRAKELEKEGKIFTILGEGELDVVGCLKALKKLNYQYGISLEYEEHPENPISDIEQCLKTVKTALTKVS
jgi:inosose dehydratase